jgi:DNA repair exonuclease SbcCD ATPase subunit
MSWAAPIFLSHFLEYALQADHAQALQCVQRLEEQLRQEGSEMHEADSNEALAQQRCEALQRELSTLEEDLSRTSVAEEEHKWLLEEVGTNSSQVWQRLMLNSAHCCSFQKASSICFTVP